jgi:hypothetical protein
VGGERKGRKVSKKGRKEGSLSRKEGRKEGSMSRKEGIEEGRYRGRKDGVEEGKLKSEDVKEELSLKGVAQADRSAPEAAVVVSFGGSDDGGGSVDVASVASAGKGYIARAGGRWRKGGR